MTQVMVEVEYAKESYLSMTLKGAIDWLTKERASIPVEYQESARFELESEAVPYEDRDRAKLTITYERPETVEETEKRVNMDTHYRNQRDIRDLAEFTRLSKRFGAVPK